MVSLIEQLQREALNKTTTVSDVLRKAYIVAMKLGLAGDQQWIEYELNGYPLKTEVPAYRHLRGRPTFFNPFRGRCELIISDPETAEVLSNCDSRQTIAELEPLASGGDQIMWPYPPKLVSHINESQDLPLEGLGIDLAKNQVVGIVEGVRNRILIWATQLELAGVKGEGDLSFSERDKELASHVTYNVHMGPGSVIGAVGQVRDQASVIAKVDESSALKTLRDLAEQVLKHASHMGLSGAEQSHLEAHARELKAELADPKPQPSKIKLLLQGIQKVAEKVATDVVARGILDLITRPEVAALLSRPPS